jgi:hypothetical protein
VFDEFFEGKNKLTKQIKSYEKRLAANRMFEAEEEDRAIHIFETIDNECDLLGMCISVDESQPDNAYYVEEIDDKYGVKLKLYSISRGTSGQMKMNKKIYETSDIVPSSIIYVDSWKKRPRYIFKDGKRIPMEEEHDFWLEKYHLAS